MINLTNKLDYKELCEFNDSCSSFLNFKVSEGWYGNVYKIKIRDRFYALKKFKQTMHDDIKERNIANYDYDILKTLNSSKHYPTIHAYKEQDWMLTDWIDGVPFREVEDKKDYFLQLYLTHLDALQSGWFPDDVKGDNILCSNGTIIVIDVGSYLPIIPDLDYSIYKKTKFIIDHANLYPSVRDESPYIFKQN